MVALREEEKEKKEKEEEEEEEEEEKEQDTLYMFTRLSTCLDKIAAIPYKHRKQLLPFTEV